MPVSTPHCCVETPPETVISRFMDMAKFHDLFANQELYFRRLDKFKNSDPQEGQPADAFIINSQNLIRGDINDERVLRNHQASNRQFSESYFLSCWHLHDEETLRMWDEYGEVAIVSTVGRLRSVLNPLLERVSVGAVRYGDEAVAGYNIFEFMFTKRDHFEGERELRVALESGDPVAGLNRQFDADNRVHREPLDDVNPLHPWVHDHKRRRIKLPRLVREIRVSPWAGQDVYDDVKTFAQLVTPKTTLAWSELKHSLTPTREEYRKSTGKRPLNL